MKCNNTGLCVSEYGLCDGYNSCGDYEDEKGCATCGFAGRCGDGRCLAWEFFCDGIAECDDGSDEQGCEACNENQHRYLINLTYAHNYNIMYIDDNQI